MLMGANDRRVDHHVFGVAVAGQVFQNALENPALAPSAEASMGIFPRAEARRQIAPGNACPVPMENGVDEQPVIGRRAAHVTLSAGKKVFDPFPFVIAQSVPIHRSTPKRADCL